MSATGTVVTHTLFQLDLVDRQVETWRKCPNGHVIEIILTDGHRAYPMRACLPLTAGGTTYVPICMVCGYTDYGSMKEGK